MKRALVVAAMFALALPVLAAAQEHHDEHKGPPPPGPHPGGPPPPHPMGPHPGGPPGPPHGPMVGPPHGPMAGPPHPPGPPAAAFVHPGVGGPPPGVHFSYHGHEINRVHARHEFIYPPGWAYRRWAVGAILPPLFLVPDYYYPEWAALGLEPPPPGYQWVRYGPDLLLVDIHTGQVADVAYDVFD
jgi:Nickel/cobalt transporter regulator